MSSGSVGRGYEGTEKSRRTDAWTARYFDPADLIASNLPLLQARSRDLARKNPLVISAYDVLVDNIVGSTFSLQALIRKGAPNSQGEVQLDDVRNTLVEEFFSDVIERELDFGNELSYIMLRALAMREILEVGEVFALFTTDFRAADRITPFCIDLIAAERVDPTFNRPRRRGENRITNGIEFDLRGRRVAYHVSALDDNGTMNVLKPKIRIPAERIRHIFRRKRVGQERGLPAVFGSSMLARDVDVLIDTELTSAQVAACLTAVVTRKGGGMPKVDASPNAETDVKDGRIITRLQSGAVMDLGVEGDVKEVGGQRPGANFDPFSRFLSRLFYKTTGLTYEAGSGDYSKTNFSSARLSDVHNWKTYRTYQGLLRGVLDKPVYAESLKWGATSGAVPISFVEYRADRRNLTRCEITLEGREHPDPVKDVMAAALRIAFNMSTLKDECAVLGNDWAKVLRQRAQEIRMQARAGLPMLSPAAAQPIDDGDEDQERTGDEGGDLRRSVRQPLGIPFGEIVIECMREDHADLVRSNGYAA